jgi:hypothetical protein
LRVIHSFSMCWKGRFRGNFQVDGAVDAASAWGAMHVPAIIALVPARKWRLETDMERIPQ